MFSITNDNWKLMLNFLTPEFLILLHVLLYKSMNYEMNLRLGSWVNFTFFVYKETDKKNNWHLHAPTKRPFNLQLPSTLRNIIMMSVVHQKWKLGIFFCVLNVMKLKLCNFMIINAKLKQTYIQYFCLILF